jgi:hypothetical protein
MTKAESETRIPTGARIDTSSSLHLGVRSSSSADHTLNSRVRSHILTLWIPSRYHASPIHSDSSRLGYTIRIPHLVEPESDARGSSGHAIRRLRACVLETDVLVSPSRAHIQMPGPRPTSRYTTLLSESSYSSPRLTRTTHHTNTEDRLGYDYATRAHYVSLAWHSELALHVTRILRRVDESILLL